MSRADTIWYIVDKPGTQYASVHKQVFFRSSGEAKQFAERRSNTPNMDWVQSNDGYRAEDSDGNEVLVARGDVL